MNSKTTILKPSNYRDMPWKNGGGVTKELVRIPHPSGDSSRFLARVSIATVSSSGPFSFFPGIDRVLMILEGTGVALTYSGSTSEVLLDHHLRPISFPGECEVKCRLLSESAAATVRDFNLMTDRNELEGSLKVVSMKRADRRFLDCDGVWILIIHVLESCSNNGIKINSTDIALSKDETILIENPSQQLELLSDEQSTLVVMYLSKRI